MSAAAAGPIRLAITGLGRMGLRHAQNAAASERFELVAVADADLARAEAVAGELGAVPCDGAAVERLLDAERPDALLVASPAASHVPLIELAAARGVHVFCEKPLSDDGPAAARAVAAAERAGIVVQVGFQMRFDRDFARVAGLIERGELGDLYQLRASLRDVAPPPREYLASSGGYYWDGMIHLFDLARWLMGEVEELTAFGAAQSDPMFAELGDVDTAVVVLRFASGALGVLDTSRVARYGFDSGLEVLGSQATVRVPGGRVDGLELLTPARTSTAYAQDFLERFEPAYPRELEAFADALQAGGASPVDGRDGLAAMRLAAAAVLSQRERRTVRVDADEIGW
ncbi:MAG TPA: Gfo/Idh/MocA family oxidoreductase [Conexibacter sp.]|jgi:predicted dehydrogenase|nr:Gfo/Idh/MocA family oxidoreductase [Conexibacter sp.]